MACDVQAKEDLKFSVLMIEENWYKRGLKEAITIKKLRPSLNKDQGRHNLSSIYEEFIRSSVSMTTSRTGAKGGSEETDF